MSPTTPPAVDLTDDFYAYCYACCNVFGKPSQIDKKNLSRHLHHPTHLKRLARWAEKSKVKCKSKTPQSILEPEIPMQTDDGNMLPTAFNETVPLNSATISSDPTVLAFTTPHPDPKSVIQDATVDDSGDLFVQSQDSAHSQSVPEDEWVSESSDSWSDSTSDSESPDEPYSEPDPVIPEIYNGKHDRYTEKAGKHSDWWPWKTKALFLADLITNSKRLRFTRRQIRVVLAYARVTQGEEIPTLKQLKKAQMALKKKLGDPTIRRISPSGHIYYMNQILHGLAQDFANPMLRKHMQFYPHLNNGKMSEVWNGAKMLMDLPDHLLTPTIRHNGKIFYVNELVRCREGWFLPRRWIVLGEARKPYAVGYEVKETLDGLHVCCDRRIVVPVSTFSQSFLELSDRQAVPKFDDVSDVFRRDMPHPLRKVAGSRLVYAVPILLFMDDVSGGISKQWNKHVSCYISNGALPRQVLQSEYSIRFVLTSKHAEASDLIYGIRDELKEGLKHLTVAFDSETQQEILFWSYPLLSAADNPMQAEQCSCQLKKANTFCRTCLVGGTTEFKQSASGYASLFYPGEKRTPTQTLHRVNTLLDLSLQPSNKTRIKEQARDWGVKDFLAQSTIDRLLEMGQQLRSGSKGSVRRQESEVVAALQDELELAKQKGCTNAFLDMDDLGFNVHEDTPTEILHTVLLGVVKYFWGQIVFVLTKSHQMRLLETRLASISISGLNIDSMMEKYMCQYTGSLIGKHFKILAQTMPFVCYDLVQPDLFEVWLLLGQLVGLLWYNEIESVDAYLVELQELIDDFLTVTACCSPSIIVQKPKFHFLVHLPMYIRRFGPSILYSTERYESFHGVFRAGSLFSNHHAPSRDIAEYFVGLDRLKHVCSGGYWKEGTSWVRAGCQAQSFVIENKDFGRLIGLPTSEIEDFGLVAGLPRTRRSHKLPQRWADFSANKSIFRFEDPHVGQSDIAYFHIASTFSQNGDRIQVGCSILFGSKLGRVEALFGYTESGEGSKYFAAVRQYRISPTKHPLFDLPVLELEPGTICVPISAAVCLINVQHDCTASKTCSQQRIAERQEREDTTRIDHRICHSDDGHFVLNLLGLHNHLRIRQALPPSLTQRRVLKLNPTEVRQQAVVKLAQASMGKSLQLKARKAAKNAFDSVVDNAAADSESQPVSTKPVKSRKRRRPAESAADDDT